MRFGPAVGSVEIISLSFSSRGQSCGEQREEVTRTQIAARRFNMESTCKGHVAQLA